MPKDDDFEVVIDTAVLGQLIYVKASVLRDFMIEYIGELEKEDEEADLQPEEVVLESLEGYIAVLEEGAPKNVLAELQKEIEAEKQEYRLD